MKKIGRLKTQGAEELIHEIHMTPTQQIWKRLCRNKISVISMVFIVLVVLAAVFANFIVDESLVTLQTADRIQGPSMQHWFGTDLYGRDLFARVLYGSRISLAIGVLTSIISLIIGYLLGAVAAFYGGVLDEVIMRVCDVFMAIPEQLLAICVVASMGASATSLIIALVIAVIPGRTRLVRSAVLGLIGTEYVEAARAAGMSDLKIIVQEILPNSLGPIIVTTTQGLASIILTASSLSYLGVGIQPPTPEWGAIISDAKEFLQIAPYMCIIPGIVMVLVALAFCLLGDGLRDALDPRLKD